MMNIKSALILVFVTLFSINAFAVNMESAQKVEVRLTPKVTPERIEGAVKSGLITAIRSISSYGNGLVVLHEDGKETLITGKEAIEAYDRFGGEELVSRINEILNQPDILRDKVDVDLLRYEAEFFFLEKFLEFVSVGGGDLLGYVKDRMAMIEQIACVNARSLISSVRGSIINRRGNKKEGDLNYYDDASSSLVEDNGNMWSEGSDGEWGLDTDKDGTPDYDEDDDSNPSADANTNNCTPESEGGVPMIFQKVIDQYEDSARFETLYSQYESGAITMEELEMQATKDLLNQFEQVWFH